MAAGPKVRNPGIWAAGQREKCGLRVAESCWAMIQVHGMHAVFIGCQESHGIGIGCQDGSLGLDRQFLRAPLARVSSGKGRGNNHAQPGYGHARVLAFGDAPGEPVSCLQNRLRQRNGGS